MRLNRSESVAQIFPSRNYTIEKFLRFEIIENSVARGRGNRMSLIRKAVHEGARAAFERLDNARGNEHGAERRVTTGHSLPYQNQVRLYAPVLNGEWFSGASHAGHNFVGDEENAILAADFRDT